MSSYHIQLIALITFLFLFTLAVNQMENDVPSGTFSGNTTLINSDLYVINQSNADSDADSLFDTVRGLATFDVSTDNNYLSYIFWAIGVWIGILLYLLIHPVKS